ncbi:hypothetical protein HS048_16845 [Planomonospora sp. ID91781]|uniref:LGFP repeat-containing protein n=1 Tax=Planomonospora sp. ID91781 TaxID=2738135 RepID=UPI0018C43400|nr:hypothetical protein [Planomonospora sp. ID91781]MBG0822412.1 hypothetical protein [Planomonospora sp. ID91781]
MPTARTLLATAAAAVAGLALLAPATAARAATARAACDASLVAPAGSLIGDLWRSNGGQNSAYGCPVTKEYGYAGKRGSYQGFRNGKIVWSPNLGGGALVRVYESGNRIVFRWSGLGRDWDFFNVRWSKDAHLGNRTIQVKVARLTPWSGALSLPKNVAVDYDDTVSHGRATDRWAFTVQGCDRGTFSSDCGPWSITNAYVD